MIFLSISVAAQSKIIISVSAETTVNDETIKLGDIAQIESDPEQAEKLKNISFGYAPNIGATREISRGQLLLAISAAGFDKGEIDLSAPPKILIRRAGQGISQDQIREAVEQTILTQFRAENISAEVVWFDVPNNIQVPVGKSEIRVNSVNISNPFAKFSVPVEIYVDGRVVRRLAVNLLVEAFAEILVTRRDLALNGKISETDVTREKRRLIKPLTSYVRNVEKLRGAVLLKNIPAGTELTTDLVAAGYVIKNGDSVRIEAQSGSFKITVSGEARASGRIGDRIAVKNLQSGTILQAVVIDEGVVSVIF